MAISGVHQAPDAAAVVQAAKIAENSLGEDAQRAELAFFGGSFTAIPRAYMQELLEAAAPYVRMKRFAGIRISTRPDAISEEILEFLRAYGVTSIELGAQSMSDRVLAWNRRGHSSETVRIASQKIRAAGFSLGLQMMTGMYGSTPETDVFTAQELATLAPDTMRIYPTIVMRGTKLEQLYQEGKYQPPTLMEAVSLCARLQDFFEEEGIHVIRTGLHSGGTVEDNRVAGPYHPAFGELCRGERLLHRVEQALLQQQITGGKICIIVHPRDRSAVVGQKRRNLQILEARGFQPRVCSNEAQKPGVVRVEPE